MPQGEKLHLDNHLKRKGLSLGIWKETEAWKAAGPFPLHLHRSNLTLMHTEYEAIPHLIQENGANVIVGQELECGQLQTVLPTSQASTSLLSAWRSLVLVLLLVPLGPSWEKKARKIEPTPSNSPVSPAFNLPRKRPDSSPGSVRGEGRTG